MPAFEKGSVWVWLIITAGLLLGLEAVLIIIQPNGQTDSTQRQFSLILPQTPNPPTATIKRKNNSNPTLPFQPSYSSNSNNSTQIQPNSQVTTVQSGPVQILSNETKTQNINQPVYNLGANFACKNNDGQIAEKHVDLEINFQIQDPQAAYFYTMVVDNSSGKTVYGPFTSGDPANSASFDVVYHQTLSGILTNTSDLELNTDGGTLKIMLYKSSDPVINGSVIKEITVNKRCN